MSAKDAETVDNGEVLAKAKGRKKETRAKILKAAQEIFSSHPYHSASIRMIGKQAGIEHPLISYYFPSKADLFRAVISDLIKARSSLEQDWFKAVEGMSPAKGLSLYLDHVLDDYRKRPGLLHIVSLNLSRSTGSEPIPGYNQIQDFVKAASRNFVKTFKLKVSLRESEMFARTLSVLLVGFLGSSHSYAAMMKMEPESILYYNWVKDTVIYTLLPRLEKIINHS